MDSPPDAIGWFDRVVLQRGSLPAEVQAILQTEAREGLRTTHLVRMVIGVMGISALLANMASNTMETIALGIASALAYTAYSGAVWLAVRRGFYREWIKYVSITVDITGVTALSLTGLSNHSGAYEVLLAPTFLLLYVLFNMLTTLHYNVAASLYGAMMSAAQRSVVLAYVLANDLVEVSPEAVYGERAVGLADQLTIIFFIAMSGVVPAWRSYASRQLLVRTAAATVAEQELQRQQASLRKYVSANVAEYMMANPNAMDLGGRRQEATVMFVDIRGFTAFAERESPERVVEFLNSFFTSMIETLFANGGTLRDFQGDGLMAIFGAPQEIPDPPGAAMSAALGMLEKVRAYNAGRSAEEFELRIGIGIAHGVVIAGNVGSPERMDYTVVGDPANFASRLQDLNKDFATEVLVSESVYAAVNGRFPLRRMPPVRVRGKRGEVAIWALDTGLGEGRQPPPPPFALVTAGAADESP